MNKKFPCKVRLIQLSGIQKMNDMVAYYSAMMKNLGIKASRASLATTIVSPDYENRLRVVWYVIRRAPLVDQTFES